MFSYTGPLRGGHDADVAHGEDEFDAPDIEEARVVLLLYYYWVVTPSRSTEGCLKRINMIDCHDA